MRVRASHLATVSVMALAFPLLGATSALADSGPASPTATHDNPSSCLGAERATRNSNGGDRAQGGFGPAQAAQVALVNEAGSNYGTFLNEWRAANC